MSYTWLQFRNAVKVLLSDQTVNDGAAAMAISDFTRARLARDLANDQTAYASAWQDYQGQRRDLLGYTYSGSQSALRLAVRALISDSNISDPIAFKAIAVYVEAMLERDRGNLPGYEAFLAEWKLQRMRLLGYTFIYTVNGLRAEIVKLITDIAPSDLTATRAVADYIQAKLALSMDGDRPAHDAFWSNYMTQRRRLVGWSITANDATVKASVIALISDVQPNDTTYVRALVDYMKAMAARDLAGDQNSYAANFTAYKIQRKKLLGYTTALSDATVKTNVKALIMDTTIDETTAIKAIANFVKSRIAVEVDKDLTIAASYDGLWKSDRARLLGYTITSSPSTLRTEVNKLITVDGDRQGIDEFITQQVALAQKEIQGLDTFLSNAILQGKADVIAMNAEFDALIPQAKADISGLTIPIDAWIAQAVNEIAGLANIVDTTIDNGKDDLSGGAPILEQFIRQAVIQLQTFVEFYRTNHQTTIAFADVTDSGEASTGTMPAGEPMLRDAYYVNVADGWKRNPIESYDWDNRFDLMNGSPMMATGTFFMAVNPGASQFLVFPALLDGNQLELFWDGIKLSFVDADVTPFDEGAVQCIADYVLSELRRRPPFNDYKSSQSHMLSYVRKRLELFRNTQDRLRIRKTTPSRFTSAHCAVNAVSA